MLNTLGGRGLGRLGVGPAERRHQDQLVFATASSGACCAYATHAGAHTYELTDPWHLTH